MTFTPAPGEPPDLYWYAAQYVDLYDADTLTLDLDLGFRSWLRDQKVRLWGIDAWELRGSERPRGLLAKHYCQQMLEESERVIIRSYRDRSEKYGRWLAEVFVRSNNETVNLNAALVAAGHAEIATY